MATYEEIHGRRVEVLSSDPTLSAGDVWYNSTSGTLKGVVSFAAWSSAALISTARSNAVGFGAQSANVIAGGSISTGKTGVCEEYNGSGWSTGGSLNTSRGELSGTTAGVLTAGLAFGGNTAPGWNGTTATEEYNGTSWTSVNNMATTVSFMGGSGVQTAAFSAGGRTPSNTTNSQEYDGTNWSNGNPINTARQGGVGTGIQTAGLYCGGESTGASADVESYDGTSWTEGANLGTARYRLGGGGDTQNTSMVFSGSVPGGTSKALTELYDGTSWTETADMGSTVKEQVSGFRGPNTAGIATGGYINSPPSWASTSEEFNQGINTITAAAWASGGALGTARWGGATMGSQTAGLFAGGGTPSTKLNNSEEYNGTSWTEGANLNTARGLMAAGGNSTQTAGLAFGGTTTTGPDNPGVTNATEEYNGTSWESVNNMNYSVRNFGGAGTQTNAVAAGGNPGPSQYNSTTGEYNGTDWTAGTSLPTALQDNQGMTGVSQSAAFFAGGEGPPGARRTDTLEYDGTNWTAGGSLFTGVMQNGASGTLTAALSFGGAAPSITTTTVGYDGTSWSTRPSMATARQYAHGAGTNTATFVAGGLGPPGANIANTEEFTGETSVEAASTLTTS